MGMNAPTPASDRDILTGYFNRCLKEVKKLRTLIFAFQRHDGSAIAEDKFPTLETNDQSEYESFKAAYGRIATAIEAEKTNLGLPDLPNLK